MADPKEQEVKQERLAAALRENLKRRKARAKEAGKREQHGPSDVPETGCKTGEQPGTTRQ